MSKLQTIRRAHSHPPGEPTIQIAFSFLSYTDISRAACTCRDWRRILADENKTPCLRFDWRVLELRKNISMRQIAQSIFKSHILRFILHQICKPEFLVDLSQLSRLRRLEIRELAVNQPHDGVYMFPPKLVTFKLQVSSDDMGPKKFIDELNAIILGIASSSPLIQSLSFNICYRKHPAIAEQINFLPLLRLQALQCFEFSYYNEFGTMFQPFIPSLMEMIRTHTSLQDVGLFVHRETYVKSVFRNEMTERVTRSSLSAATIRGLTTPTPARVEYIDLGGTIIELPEMNELCKLQTLTMIQPAQINLPSLDCMSHFPNCLTFDCKVYGMSLSSMVSGLQKMTQLQCLTLRHANLTSQAMADIVSHLPHLTSLGLCSGSEVLDLQWVKALPADRMKTLMFEHCRNIKVSEISELAHFCKLDRLIIIQSFQACETVLPMKQLTPPSTLLPSLQILDIV